MDCHSRATLRIFNIVIANDSEAIQLSFRGILFWTVVELDSGSIHLINPNYGNDSETSSE